MRNGHILAALRGGYTTFGATAMQRVARYGYNRALRKLQELTGLGYSRPVPDREWLYELVPQGAPAPSTLRPHLHTGDVDAWIARYGAPLQIGQWVRIKTTSDYSAEARAGAYMVTRLDLDIRTGRLMVAATEGQGTMLTNWAIEDLEPATHGHR